MEGVVWTVVVLVIGFVALLTLALKKSPANIPSAKVVNRQVVGCSDGRSYRLLRRKKRKAKKAADDENAHGPVS